MSCNVIWYQCIYFSSDDVTTNSQAIANTNEPAYGTLLTSNVLQTGSTVSLGSLFSPLIEPEIMFLLTEDLSPGADELEILQKSKIAAGIEIPDARYIDWFPNFSLADLLCDNTATGLIVVSNPISVPTLQEFETIEMELYHNGEKISEGVSSAVLGNPVLAVKWLSQKLADNNKTLKKGMVISSGTFISPLPAKEGTYKVTYSDVGEAEVTFTA
ncbi:2-keto-4-pentenoate hydratase [Oceanobacillus sp. CAU 1775]